MGCAAKHQTPNIGALYQQTAQYHDPQRNPVILIPGILGSKLVDTTSQRLVWGAFAGGYANPQKPDGARLVALPMCYAAPLTSLRDGVKSKGALDRLKITFLGLPVELNAYVDILASLGISGGYRDEQLGLAGAIDYGDDHFTCFQFDYDWRRDNVENAILLHQFILRKKAYVRREIKKRYGIENFPVKFDLVAHSMGGLIARYYLRFGANGLPADGSVPPVNWQGSRLVEHAIFIGPPNAGSLDALTYLVEGRKFSLFLPRYEAALLSTMPSIYQLLPRGRHGALVDAADTTRKIEKIFDPDFWVKMGWGLAAPEQDKVLRYLLPDEPDREARRKIALDHQRKCLLRAKQFTAALDVPATPPDSLDLYLIAGDAIPTAAVAAVNLSNGHIKIIRKEAGDGTVLRSSALMDERVGAPWKPVLVSPIKWSQVLFLFTEHLEMTKDPAFTDNLLFMLLESPR